MSENVTLNFEKILTHIDYLRDTDEYLPLLLHRFASPDYYNKLSKKDKQRFYKNRTALQGASDFNEFLGKELLEWLKDNKEFEDIIQNG